MKRFSEQEHQTQEAACSELQAASMFDSIRVVG